MACYNRMERTFLQGLLWMYLLGFGFMALSLEPGFLDFDNLPDTNFTCVGKVIGGYYADLETNCQMFHVCTIGQLDEPMDIRFLCLNGTVFDQETRVCERIDEVDCTKSEQFYSLNLELYGNSQPSNLEENPETEQPLIIKSTPPSTTTPTEPTPRSTSTRPAYYATPTQQRLPSHHFPVVDANSSPDIRFNPEEINVSLNAGAPPDFRTNQNRPVSYYSDKKATETKGGGTSTQGSDYDAFGGYDRVTPREVNFAFEFGEAREEEYDFQTQYKPSQQYGAPPHESSFPSSTYRGDYSSSTTAKASNYHHQVSPTTSSTTARSFYSASPVAKRRSHYEEAPQRIQLPLPALTFSTPAPFSLQRRVEQKRYTKEHLPPPRIVVSASASVSDASGRRLNYSLGTIDASPLLKQPPASYDNYKDEDVVLDPFYIDVQKLKSRRKRHAQEETPSHYDIIKNDEDAVRVLKFLFDWYRSEKTTPLTSEGITAINDELAPQEGIDFELKSSDVFDKRSKYSLVDAGSVTRGHEEVKKVNNVEKHITFEDSGGDDFKHEEDYVNDNYEPEAYDHKYGFDEEAKNFSFADEYVDDNIEPIIYRTHESYPENDTNQLEDSESTTGSLETTTEFAPTQTTRATEMPTTRKQRRGRRKFQMEATVEDEELKPHRAKDDFDYLRTVHLHASTPKTTPSGDREDSNQLGDATATLEESRKTPPEEKLFEEAVVTTTESFRNTKRRRGKHKYQDETNQKKPQRRRKPPKPPEVGPAPSQKNSSSVGEETIYSALGNSSSTERNPSSMEAPLEVSIEATTKLEVIKSRRGRMKFLSSAEPESSSTPPKREEVLGTPTIPSIPLDDSVPNESFPQATSTTIVEDSTYPYSKHLEEVYATAFVPTTDSVHITKKKQLKENLLNSEFPTTESSLELNTIRGSDSTEDYTQSSDFLPTGSFDTTEKDAELSTETSMLTDSFTEVTGAPVTTKFGHIFPENMSLVNIVVEEIDTTTDRGRKQETTDVPTESSEASTESPGDSTEKPVVSTETQFSTTKSPVASTKSAVSTKSPFDSTEPPVASTKSPVASKKSAVSTKSPFDSTEPPVGSTESQSSPTKSQFSPTKSQSPTTTESPVESTESPVDSTELPVGSTDSLVAPKESQPFPTKSPAASTKSAVDSTEPPVDSTEKSVISTDLSMAPTETQFSPTKSAVVSTKSPVDSTELPAVSTESQSSPTKSQFSSTKSRSSPTKSAVASTKSPVDSTESPVDSTEKSVVSTDLSMAPTETQFFPTKSAVASTKSPAASTKSAVDSTESPVDSTEPPVDPTESPVDSTEPPVASPVASLTTLLDEETDSTQIPTTFEQTTTTTRRPQRRRGGKPTRRRPSGYSSSSSPRHRFHAQEFTRRGKESTTSTTVVKDEAEVLTEYPLRKSVNPTQAERGSGTTPLSRKASTGRKLFFNCFGKEVDRFYPDSRDCRLFHYCTRGYNENQLLDMKFVCDFNTFFDDERVICTKTKPKRCL